MPDVSHPLAPTEPIDFEVEVAAPPTVTWAALTDPDRVATWFTAASTVGRIGDPYRLDFGDGSVVEGVIDEVEPGRTFAYTWLWVGSEAHEETRVEFTIEPRDGGGSTIRLVHDGWSEAGLDAAARDDHEGYWAGYLEDLVTLLGRPS